MEPKRPNAAPPGEDRGTLRNLTGVHDGEKTFLERSIEGAYALLDAASSEIASYVQAHTERWTTDNGGTLTTLKASTYAMAVASLWSSLPQQARISLFAAVETNVFQKDPAGISDIWCTGFLEQLAHQFDRDPSLAESMIPFMGRRSLEYLNALNAFHRVPPWRERPR